MDLNAHPIVFAASVAGAVIAVLAVAAPKARALLAMYAEVRVKRYEYLARLEDARGEMISARLDDLSTQLDVALKARAEDAARHQREIAEFRDKLTEALTELAEARVEIAALRAELHVLRTEK